MPDLSKPAAQYLQRFKQDPTVVLRSEFDYDMRHHYGGKYMPNPYIEELIAAGLIATFSWRSTTNYHPALRLTKTGRAYLALLGDKR
jgi:hypothetical protein